MQEVARQAIREYVEGHSRAELLDRVLDEELPRYAEALERGLRLRHRCRYRSSRLGRDDNHTAAERHRTPLVTRALYTPDPRLHRTRQ
jgi:hypothetical protein